MKPALISVRMLLLASALLFLSSPVAPAQTVPTITQDLTNQIAIVGGSVNFSVAVSGSPPFTYQWQFNGTNLPNLIATFAGSGSSGYSGDGGPATNAALAYVYSMAADPSGNLFFADSGNNRIREVGTNGIITTVVGTGTAGYSGDGGPATNATLSAPFGVARDSLGNLFISGDNLIRKVDTNGIITTVAGNTNGGYSGDGGPATNAQLNEPLGLAVDASGNLFIADYIDYVIRKVDPNGIITTFAGGGGGGDGVQATNAALHNPYDVAVDTNGNVFIADTYAGRIREVGTNGIINTVAGGGPQYPGNGGPATNASLSYPFGVALDGSGDLFIADTFNALIQEVDTNGIITTVAGNGGDAYSGDDGPATNAAVNQPGGVTVDAFGNVFIADTENYRIREIASLNTPTLTLLGLTTSNSGSYDVIISNSSGSVTSSVAILSVGSPAVWQGSSDTPTVGAGSNATFSVRAGGTAPLYYQWLFDGSPLAGQTNATLTINAVAPTNAGSYQAVITNLYGSATSGVLPLTVLLIVNQPRSQTVTAGSNVTFGVTTTATAPFNYQWFFDGTALPGQTSSALALNAVSLTNSGSYDVVVTNSLYGAATSSVVTLNVGDPPALTTQPQNQTVLEGNNATLSVTVGGTGPFTYQWQEDGTNIPNGIITTVAGTGGFGYSGDGGEAVNAKLDEPYGVTVDAYGNLFIADTFNRRIRKVAADGIITTLAGNGTNGFSGDGGAATNAMLSESYGLAVDTSGDLFIADTFNNRIRKVGPNGFITTVAGDSSGGYNGNGLGATNTSLNEPQGIAVDADGNLFIADTFNQRIREGTFGIIVTVAGDGGSGYFNDGGPALNAALDDPSGVALDSDGNLFIADMFNQRIRKVDENGIITTVAGGGNSFPGDGGLATNALLASPRSVAVDISGDIIFTDSQHNRIRKVSTNGIITTVAGGGNSYVGNGGQATNAELGNLNGVAVDAYGNVFIADTTDSRILKVVVQGPTFLVTNYSTNTSTNIYDVVVTSPYGSVTSAVATITEVFAPGLVTAPQSQVALVGGNVTFSVTANGTAPFYYQWYFDGVPLAHQTNTTLVLSNVSSNNAGNYQVMIANAYASVTSSLAALSVVSPTLKPPPQPVVAGSTATLAVTVYGAGPLTYQWQCNGTNLPTSTVTTIAGGGTQNPGDGGAATNAVLSQPYSVAVDASGDVFIADTDDNRIRKVGTNGIITTVAGGGNSYPGDGGAATNAGLDNPTSLALDAMGDLFFAETYDSRIRKVGTNGILTTVAGGGNSYPNDGDGDGGLATNGSLNYPYGIALDAYGNLFIADTHNNCIREAGTNGIITTVAGTANPGYAGYAGDGGAAIDGKLNSPRGVAVDAYGNLFIADSSNQRIREVGANGIIITVAGNGNSGYSGDGVAATNTTLSAPVGVTVDAFGDLFIADSANGRIRETEVGGTITSVAPGISLSNPSGTAMDAAGDLFIADTGNNRVRKVVFQGPVLVLTNVSAANSGSYDVVVTSSHGSATTGIATIAVLLPPENLSASLSTEEGVQIQFTGTPITTYVLQATTNLAPPASWEPVVTNLTDASGNWSFLDTNALASHVRFYRAMLP